MDVGSVEYVVIAFPGNRFSGGIMPEPKRPGLLDDAGFAAAKAKLLSG